MPIPQLNLDDRTFEQLAAEGRALIPRYFPAWTDYNESDPGITLLELFAFFIEASIYQINRVPERSLERFAALVGVARAQGEAIEQTLRRALAGLQQQFRAVTETDFETLAVAANPSAVSRAKAVVDEAPAAIVATVQSAGEKTINVSQFNSTRYGLRAGAPVTVTGKAAVTTLAIPIGPNVNGVTRIIVHDVAFSASIRPGDVLQIAVQAPVFPIDQFVKIAIVQNPGSAATVQLDALRQQVFAYLAPRRLITTRVNVVAPDQTTVNIGVAVARAATSRTPADAVANTVTAAITDFLSPLSGGVSGAGWPFGRSVYRSELDSLVESLADVDHIAELALNGDDNIGEVKLASPLSLVRLGQLSVNVVDS